MADRHTLEELNNCSREELITIVLMMQGQLDTIDGQLSFFDEAENCCTLSVPEPAAEEVLPFRRNHKKKGRLFSNLLELHVLELNKALMEEK
jgi:transposase